VLLDGLQAGNRSGTGVYTERLVHWLPRVEADLELTVLWPADAPKPEADDRVRFIRCATRHGRRFFAGSYGLRRETRWGAADIVHFPASVGSIFPLPRTVVTVHDL